MTTKIKSGVIAAGAIDANALSDNSITIAHLNCSDGTNGQVLSTDGSGTLSFTDMTGGVDGIVSSADATAITIDSSERVGIGTTNPGYNLDIWGATDPAVRVYNTGTGSSDDSLLRLQIGGSTARNFIYFGDTDDSDIGNIEYNHSDNSMRFTTNTAEAFRVHNSGAISVGSDEVYGLFNVEGSINFNGNIRPNANTDGGSESAPTICVGYDNDTGFFHPTSNTIGFTTLGSERMRIDSSGRVGIGAAPQTAPYYNNDDPVLTVHKASGNAILPIVAAANTSSAILHLNQAANRYWRLSALYGGALTFGGKQPGSGAAESEAMRINSSGNVGINDTAPAGQLEVRNTTNQPTGIFAHEANNLTGYTDIMSSGTFTANSVNHQYFVCKSGNGSAISDNEFNLRGDGNAYADGSWNGGGADYAEYFEWEDGNSSSEDRRGWSVVLINEKIRRATSDDDASTIIGVISGNPGVVGDSDIQGKWKGKYLKDDFGTPIRETVQAYHWKTVDDDGQIISHNMHEDRVPEGVIVPTVEENDTFTSTTVNRKVNNPAYVEGQEYVQRENRPEWDTVGLMGKLRILKTEQKGPNWIKMRDISDTVEEWLVR